MNMKQFRRQYEAIEKQADQQLTELAAKVRQEVIIPYCDKHKLYFVQGNGTYSFFNNSNEDLTNIWNDCQRVPKHIIDKLELECNLFRFPLFQFMQDYDGRNSK